MGKTRRKVLKEFTRNIGGQIIYGHPEHPDENGRFLQLDEDVAAVLADEGLIEGEHSNEKMPQTETGERRVGGNDTIMGLIAEGAGKGVGGGDTNGGDGNSDGAKASEDGRNSAQAVREKQNAGQKAPVDQKGKGSRQRGGTTDKTKAPAGGSTETANVNHPAESGPNTKPAEIPGNQSEGEVQENDPDAAPTGGAGS